MTDAQITNPIIDEFDRLTRDGHNPVAIQWLDCLNADLTGRSWDTAVWGNNLHQLLDSADIGPRSWEATEARFVLANRALDSTDNPLLALFRNARDEHPIRERAAEALNALGGPSANDATWTEAHPKVELLYDARTVLHGLAGPAAR